MVMDMQRLCQDRRRMCDKRRRLAYGSTVTALRLNRAGWFTYTQLVSTLHVRAALQRVAKARD